MGPPSFAGKAPESEAGQSRGLDAVPSSWSSFRRCSLAVQPAALPLLSGRELVALPGLVLATIAFAAVLAIAALLWVPVAALVAWLAVLLTAVLLVAMLLVAVAVLLVALAL